MEQTAEVCVVNKIRYICISSKYVVFSIYHYLSLSLSFGQALVYHAAPFIDRFAALCM